MRPALLLPLLLACLCGCRGSAVPANPERLPRVELTVPGTGTVRVYYTREIGEERARSLLKQVAAVCSEVHQQLGFVPPRTEVVIYQPVGPPGTGGRHVRETRADLVQEADGWRIRFAYPWRDEPEAVGQLLGTTAHEIAESTILLRVTVIDPYLRWLHDGIAELVEHEVLRLLQPAAALDNLRRMVQFIGERREDGIGWVDLSRWRQLAPYLVRSHRFLGPRESNLSLDRLNESLRRVRNATVTIKDPVLLRGLEELEVILQAARREKSRGWEPGEARPDDALTQDFLFYNAAFSLWLGLERAHPGTVRRTLRALAARREADDHVLHADEAREAARVAALRDEPVPLRLDLDQIEGTLRGEMSRLR